ncbi:hypothetical protein [Legionella sp. CNM-4043-24]|uniref:hypothetical protein n=1 Tax=Legionella sp. CNM-4043-24 TaxID=3421646 RepID=UPI00403AA8A2
MGKICWKKDFKPHQLLSILENAKIIANGKVSFTGWEIPSITVAVKQSISFPEQYSEIDQNKVIKEALNNVASHAPITPDKVLEAVQLLAEKYKKLQPENYFLLSKLSINFIDIVVDKIKPNKNQIQIALNDDKINYVLYSSPKGTTSGTIEFDEIGFNPSPRKDLTQQLKDCLPNVVKLLDERNELKKVLIKEMTIGDIKVSFYRGDFPSKFNGRNELIRNIAFRSKMNDPGYIFTVIKVTANNEKSAFNKALKTLHAIRAYLCLIYNPYPSFEYNINPFVPINSIRTGEVSTLHNENGDAHLIFNIENDFKPKEIIISETKALNIILKDFKSTLKSSYKNKLIEALNCYVTALDSKDHNVGLMRIWNAIEILTSKQEDSFDKVVKRFSLLYANEPYRLQILMYIRDFRNRFVHNNEDDINAKHYCFELQKAFKDMLFFQLHNSSIFESFDDMLAFLDLPKTKSALTKKSKLINRAVKYAK